MTRTEKIEASLRAAFAPRRLEVIDDSESHRGHAGFREGGETHYIVTLHSDRFEGMGRIARHRAVHAALGPELMAEIHALQLNLQA